MASTVPQTNPVRSSPKAFTPTFEPSQFVLSNSKKPPFKKKLAAAHNEVEPDVSEKETGQKRSTMVFANEMPNQQTTKWDADFHVLEKEEPQVLSALFFRELEGKKEEEVSDVALKKLVRIANGNEKEKKVLNEILLIVEAYGEKRLVERHCIPLPCSMASCDKFLFFNSDKVEICDTCLRKKNEKRRYCKMSCCYERPLIDKDFCSVKCRVLHDTLSGRREGQYFSCLKSLSRLCCNNKKYESKGNCGSCASTFNTLSHIFSRFRIGRHNSNVRGALKYIHNRSLQFVEKDSFSTSIQDFLKKGFCIFSEKSFSFVLKQNKKEHSEFV